MDLFNVWDPTHLSVRPWNSICQLIYFFCINGYLCQNWNWCHSFPECPAGVTNGAVTEAGPGKVPFRQNSVFLSIFEYECAKARQGARDPPCCLPPSPSHSSNQFEQAVEFSTLILASLFFLSRFLVWISLEHNRMEFLRSAFMSAALPLWHSLARALEWLL